MAKPAFPLRDLSTDWVGQTNEQRLLQCVDALYVHGEIEEWEHCRIRAQIEARASFERMQGIPVLRPEVDPIDWLHSKEMQETPPSWKSRLATVVSGGLLIAVFLAAAIALIASCAPEIPHG